MTYKLIAVDNATKRQTLITPPFAADTAQSAEADGTIAIAQPIYLKSNGHVDLAQANAAGTTQVCGLALTGAVATNSVDYQIDGVIERSDWTAITGSASLQRGAVYFLSAATAGRLTTTAPTSGYSVVVGRALTTTRFDISIQPAIRL